MYEASKAALRRKAEMPYWEEKVFIGTGVDIGCGDDPCNRMVEWNIKTLHKFDFEQGDANYIRHHFGQNSLDFVHSSHSLEHMSRHPWNCVIDWCSLIKVGGHLVITVPDFEMYEKMHWPSLFNADHKWAFYTHTMQHRDYLLCFNDIVPILESIGMEVIKCERLTTGYNPSVNYDQTISFEDRIECAWEILAVKKQDIKTKTPITIQRHRALGDTIAVAPFYNALREFHDVTFVTSEEYFSYHPRVNCVTATNRIDIDLNGYDIANPNVPLYQLGFHKTRIPMPSVFDFNIMLESIESTDYIVVDKSDIWLKSRRVGFNIPESIVNKYKIIELSPMSPDDLIQLIGQAKLVIGRDSAPIHLAQALGTKFIAITSSVNPELRYLNGISLFSTCPFNLQHCYHIKWDRSDCPSPEYYPPCGVISDERMEQTINEILK